MNIAIVCDLLIKKELCWCGISNEIALKLKRDLSTIFFCESFNINIYEHDLIILWTHENDQKDYSSIIALCKESKKFIHVHFGKSIEHKIYNCTDTFSRANYQLSECPPYLAYSRHYKAIRSQIKNLLKHELLNKKQQ